MREKLLRKLLPPPLQNPLKRGVEGVFVFAPFLDWSGIADMSDHLASRAAPVPTDLEIILKLVRYFLGIINLWILSVLEVNFFSRERKERGEGTFPQKVLSLKSCLPLKHSTGHPSRREC